MIGKIKSLFADSITIELTVDITTLGNILSLHVIIEDQQRKLVGEVTEVSKTEAKVQLIGEITNNVFHAGAINKPTFNSVVRKINEQELKLIISNVDNSGRNIHVGSMLLYNNYPVDVSVNDFFSNHFSIFGNTGSGKSSSVARLIQNIHASDVVPYNSNIFIFDAYGEYEQAFTNMQTKNPVNFKALTTNVKSTDTPIIKIPLWLLGVDDLAILLSATEPSQLAIIEKALKLVNVFAKKEEAAEHHKNDIIARALFDILSSGRAPTQIRDQVFAVLTLYNTEELSLESKVVQPGYVRTLRQCFNIDQSGKINEMQLVSEFLQTFVDQTLELSLPDGTYEYSLRDLEIAFEFALISEGILKSDKVFDYTNILKVRLHSLVNGDYSKLFDRTEFISRDTFLKEILFCDNGKKAQIVNFNISYVDDRFAKSIIKILSKMLFDFTTMLKNRASFPIHIIVEEAHRYVQNDDDAKLLGYNIFDRIAKEGRKYGVLLGLISQRPSELSETALSQCTNFLIFRMLHPKDLAYISEMVPNMTLELITKIKTLTPGICVAFGNAFKIPVIVKFDMPNPHPRSNNCDINSTWYPPTN